MNDFFEIFLIREIIASGTAMLGKSVRLTGFVSDVSAPAATSTGIGEVSGGMDSSSNTMDIDENFESSKFQKTADPALDTVPTRLKSRCMLIDRDDSILIDCEYIDMTMIQKDSLYQFFGKIELQNVSLLHR